MPWGRWRQVLTGVERALLPPECLLCRGSVPVSDGDALVCSLCRARWEAVTPPWCGRCGQPTGGDWECRVCAAWPGGLARVRSAVWLGDSARHAVHALKFGGWWRVAESLARSMLQLDPLVEMPAGPPMLVPVPLGSRRRRLRGYNQSERLAEALARARGWAVEPEWLRRTRETQTQTALPPDARLANVTGAFVAGACRGAAVVLVDDVFTTGATMVAAATALLAGGAVRVEAVTFARARELV